MNTKTKRNLNKTALTLSLGLLGLSLAPVPAHADAIEANIGVTSNYVWRGVSQTGDAPAVSGGIDYIDESGFYIGTWASNVDFGDGSEVEWDLYAGFSGGTEGIGYDVGYIAYLYPNSRDSNFHEIAASASIDAFTLGAHYIIASDVVKTPGVADAFVSGDLYLYSGYEMPISETWSTGVTLGYFMFDQDGLGGDRLDYFHGQLDFTKSAGELGDFALSFSLAEKQANEGDGDLRVFASWTKGF